MMNKIEEEEEEKVEREVKEVAKANPQFLFLNGSLHFIYLPFFIIIFIYFLSFSI